MDNNSVPNNAGDKRERFFFNMNHFDVEEEEEAIVEDLPPPPPVFSEDELAAAKAEAFAKGKEEGLAEAAASRSQALAQTLNGLVAEAIRLFSEEAARERLFAEESLQLSLNIFEKIFPHTAQTHGFTELEAAMGKVLADYAGDAHITVEVSEGMKDGVEQFLEKLAAKDENLKFKVSGSAEISDQGCKMSWSDGGFVRDSDAMAQEIQKILSAPLAQKPSKGHDNKEISGETADPLASQDDSSDAEPQDDAVRPTDE